MDPAIVSRIALELSLPEKSVAATVELFEKGATAPFVARFRKEATGGINAIKVRAVEERLAHYQDILARRTGLLKLATDQKKLTSELRQAIEGAITKVELDDIAQCLRPKKRTRATEAQEKGLEPLADYLWNQEPDAWSLEEHADVFVNADKQVVSREQALLGASDIIAEWVAESLESRARLRELFAKEGAVVSAVVPAKAAQKTKYNMYYNRREPVAGIPSHRVLAIRRGSKEGVLTTAIECDPAKALEILTASAIKDKESVFAPILELAIRDSYVRILRPLIETQVRAMLKERADREAIRVFQDNLANLLLTPPAGAMMVLGIDIGKGDEARFAIVREDGALLEEAAVRLRPPKQAQQTAGKGKKGKAAVQVAADSTAEAATPAQTAEPSADAIATQAPAPEDASTAEKAAPQESEVPAQAAAEPAETPERAESEVMPAVSSTEASETSEPAAVEIADSASKDESPAENATQEEVGAVLTTPAETSALMAPPEQANAPVAAVEPVPLTEEDCVGAARKQLGELISRHSVKAIAIGNSAAGRNLEEMVRQILTDAKIENVLVTAVNDAGVAIYSSSRIAREELSEQSVAARCATSLARRLQDPLSELVKVDPKLIGVGQYQHDVDQKELHRGLLQTVRSCVNHVGVDLNSAGVSLLKYVSGLNDKVARKIVATRSAKGPYAARAALSEASGLDAQAFDLAAGFLRIRGGANPLDGTAIHPEAYPIVEKMAAALNVGVADLIGNRELVSGLKLEDFVSETAGLPTLQDIRDELLRPGRDPRKTFKIAHFRGDVKQIADLKEGMTMEGTVTNVTNFGAFVDIGVHQDGLVHLSQMSNRFIRDPREAVKVGDVVKVKVISVEMETKRIGLSIKALLPPPVRHRKKPHKGAPASAAKGRPQRQPAAAPAAQDESAPDPPRSTPAEGRRDAGRRDHRRPDPRRGGRRPESRRSEGGRRERDRNARASSRSEEKPAEAAGQSPEPAPPQPQLPEPTLQEKIAILQSKFRGIN